MKNKFRKSLIEKFIPDFILRKRLEKAQEEWRIRHKRNYENEIINPEIEFGEAMHFHYDCGDR